MASAKSEWLKKPIRGILLDITGVLYDSGGEGGGTPIRGSIEAVQRLQSSDFSLRFCSNESQNSREGLLEKLRRFGFQMTREQLFTPAPAVAQLLRQRNLRPYLLIHPKVESEFDGIAQEDPNAVVMGDAGEWFTYENMNSAFQLLMSLERPKLFTMGYGKYYMETDGLKLDVGAYARALEFACDIEAEVVGKPSSTFFQAAVNDMKLTNDAVVMIGDDIVSDVGGAQKCGIRGVQVKTGKWRDWWENHPQVRPDAIVDNLSTFADFVLKK